MSDAVTKEAVYVGQAEAAGGKIAHRWQVDGEEMWFSKPAGGVVGGIYMLKMTPDLKSVYRSPAIYTMKRIEDKDQIALWELAHRSVVSRRTLASAERKHKADGELDRAFEPLDRVIGKLRNINEAYALAEIAKRHVLDEYHRSRK